jgi:hypothetical protein
MRRAKQPALFFIVLYTRSSRTTENSFTHFEESTSRRSLFEFLQSSRENSVLLSRILVSRAQNKGRFAMAKTAADVLIEGLIDWGVDVIFGLPGDGINGIMESLRTHQEQIRFVQVRHEEAAAFMACAYAKFTGKLGVCLATSGPGGIHLLNGLYGRQARWRSRPCHYRAAVSRPE